MLNIKNVTIKNFMSVGQVTQVVNFNEEELILILGENLDQGGNDSRNGCGKTSIMNALSYVMFGEAIVKIKMDNLINKVNNKNMMVTMDFSKDNVNYRIERGRKPNILKLINLDSGSEVEDNESQGENKDTQRSIEDIIGFNLVMFKQIIALNTSNEPFLSMTVSKQREIIENLLGITKLSEKAELLKVQIKETKDALKEEEYRLKSIEDSNSVIESQIENMINRSELWEKRKQKDITDFKMSIEELRAFDSSSDIDNHKYNELAKENNNKLKDLTNVSSFHKRTLQSIESDISSLTRELSTYNKSSNCPTCGNVMGEEKRIAKIQEIAQKIIDKEEDLEKEANLLASALNDMDGLEEMSLKPTFYRTLEESMNANNKISKLEDVLSRTESETNPYIEQIEEMKSTGFKKLDYSTMNELTDLKDHQEFLLKLLTNKDSFIRKSIIDQNLILLNNRLEEYADKLGLPHTVKFKPDLDVEIEKYGKDFDFDNLSRGEKTRLILSLSWAFRDVYESLNDRINLMFIDELMDNGLDTNGVECGLKSLKKMTKENERNVFLVSHREELIGRVSGILKVIKENDFTSFECSYNGNV